MLPSDLTLDSLQLDGAQTVSITLRRPEGRTTITVANALRRALTRDSRSFDGVQLRGGDTVWHVPQAALPGSVELFPGDTLADGTDTWSIEAATREALGTRWRCECRRMPG
ncbi:MAG: hypothetical protein ACKV0T_02735 [Planctomycetales bacterium]